MNQPSNKFIKSTDPSRTYLGTINTPAVRTGSLKRADGLPVEPAAGLQRFAVMHSFNMRGCGGATLIDADPSNLPNSFQCAHCLQIVSGNRAVLDNHSVHIFGDESTGPADPPDVVTYALVVFKECNVYEAESSFIETARRLGLPSYPDDGTELHCRDFFQRNDGPWNRVATGGKRWWIAKQLLNCLQSHRPFYAVGVADFASYPKEMRTTKTNRQTNKEHLYSLAFQAAKVQLEQYGFLSDDVQRKVWLDPQKTLIQFWDLPRAQVGRLFESTSIKSEAMNKKPVLLQAADLIAYMAGRANSNLNNNSIYKARELLSHYSINVAHAKWNPNLPMERHDTEKDVYYQNVR